jgi:glutamate/tyrosine decarboxylase-like PLP-dependent enzyme
MGISASYLTQSAPGGPRDNFDWTPEFSRRARGFVVYTAVKHLGRRGVTELVERCCARATQFAELLRGHKGIEILNDVVLNQALVRFGNSDEVTRAVIDRVQRGGVCWMGGTTWHGLAAMRISVSNWSTSERDVEMSAEAVLHAAELE